MADDEQNEQSQAAVSIDQLEHQKIKIINRLMKVNEMNVVTVMVKANVLFPTVTRIRAHMSWVVVMVKVPIDGRVPMVVESIKANTRMGKDMDRENSGKFNS